jgi:hypothetical protein
VVVVACFDLSGPAGLAGEAERTLNRKEIRDGRKGKKALQVEGRSSG